MDLLTLLYNDPPIGETSIVVNGQTPIIGPSDRQAKKQEVVLNIHFWTQADSMYAATLISAEATTKPVSRSPGSHVQCIATGKRSGGKQWLQ